MTTKLQSVELLAIRQGMLRARDLRANALPTSYLGRLVRAGRLVRRGRGLYAPAKQEIGERHDWELACLRVPHGVLCLTTALAFHDIGTQSPRAVWMAIDGKAWKPRVTHPPMRFVRFTGAALRHGVTTTASGSTPLRVYSAAKTVADCFKYRRKIGLDVAVEALREGWRARKFNLAELTKAARVCRVARVIQPYLEMLA
jgi:predicted transcriptional regulator of viral defense system